MAPTEPGSFPLALFMIFIATVIVLLILIISHVFTNADTVSDERKDDLTVRLAGLFSIQSLIDTSSYITAIDNISGSRLIDSNSTAIPCNHYRWIYNPTDQTLEWGMNTIDMSDELKLVVTATLTPGTPITLQRKETPGPLNRWIYNAASQTWCLQSNPNLCIFERNRVLTLETRQDKSGFGWGITEELYPPACSV